MTLEMISGVAQSEFSMNHSHENDTEKLFYHEKKYLKIEKNLRVSKRIFPTK